MILARHIGETAKDQLGLRRFKDATGEVTNTTQVDGLETGGYGNKSGVKDATISALLPTAQMWLSYGGGLSAARSGPPHKAGETAPRFFLDKLDFAM